MEESNFMLALLISRPSSPSKDFDIFMVSLIEELQQLLTQNMHSAPITQQAEKLSFARAERK
jgi:hypothetical protein